MKLHGDVLAATDFFTAEVATWHGLMTYYVLVVMELSTRRVEIAGITPHPTAAFMQQCARQLTDPFDGFLLGKRYLLHDRDTKFTAAFDALLKASGVEPLHLPPQSPNLNAYCERFIRSIKEEALGHMVILGEPALSYMIHQYLAHYHAERNHQGLANQLITPEPDLGSQIGRSSVANAWAGSCAITIAMWRDSALLFNHTSDATGNRTSGTRKHRDHAYVSGGRSHHQRIRFTETRSCRRGSPPFPGEG